MSDTETDTESATETTTDCPHCGRDVEFITRIKDSVAYVHEGEVIADCSTHTTTEDRDACVFSIPPQPFMFSFE